MEPQVISKHKPITKIAEEKTPATKFSGEELFRLAKVKAPPLTRRHFVFAALSALCFASTLAILWILLPPYLSAYGADSVSIGLVVGALGLGLLVGSSFFSRELSIRSPRTIMTFGGLVYLSLPPLHYISISPITIILTRLWMGFGTAALLLALHTLANYNSTPERPPWATKAFLSCIFAGLLLGFVFGGYLQGATSFNWSLFVSFITATLTFLLAAGLSEPKRKTLARPFFERRRPKLKSKKVPGERLDWALVLPLSLALIPLGITSTWFPQVGSWPQDSIYLLSSLVIFSIIIYFNKAKPQIAKRKVLLACAFTTTAIWGTTLSFPHLPIMLSLSAIFAALPIAVATTIVYRKYSGGGHRQGKGTVNLLASAGLGILIGSLGPAVLTSLLVTWVAWPITALASLAGFIALARSQRGDGS